MSTPPPVPKKGLSNSTIVWIVLGTSALFRLVMVGMLLAIAIPALAVARQDAFLAQGQQQGDYKVTQQGNVTNYETEGNLAPTAAGIPGSVEEITPEHNPVNIMLLARNKLDEGDTDSAAMAFIIARIYGAYDTQRVADQSAHQGISVLTMEAFNGVEPDKMKALDTALKGLDLEEITQTAREIGKPAYRPSYMIQHGIQAFTGQTGDGLVPGFDPDAAWEKVLDYRKD
jgi:hypothetical protein